MELSRLLAELTAVAERAGLAVRSERLVAVARRGGLCTVRGRRTLLVDASAPLPDQIAVIAAALATLDLDDRELHPVVRATIGAHRRGAGPADARPRPRARARKRER